MEPRVGDNLVDPALTRYDKIPADGESCAINGEDLSEFDYPVETGDARISIPCHRASLR